MRGGHNRKPDQLHVLQGTARPSRTKKGRPRVPAGAPRCPSWLTPAAKRIWRELAPGLEAAGLLTVLDVAAFAMYVNAVADFRRATETLAREGSVSIGHRGVLRKSPWVTIQKNAAAAVLTLGRDFGLTPSSRQRISVTPLPPEDDAFALWEAGLSSRRPPEPTG